MCAYATRTAISRCSTLLYYTILYLVYTSSHDIFFNFFTHIRTINHRFLCVCENFVCGGISDAVCGLVLTRKIDAMFGGKTATSLLPESACQNAAVTLRLVMDALDC